MGNEFRYTDDSGSFVGFCVADNGVGILVVRESDGPDAIQAGVTLTEGEALALAAELTAYATGKAKDGQG